MVINCRPLISSSVLLSRAFRPQDILFLVLPQCDQARMWVTLGRFPWIHADSPKAGLLCFLAQLSPWSNYELSSSKPPWPPTNPSMLNFFSDSVTVCVCVSIVLVQMHSSITITGSIKASLCECVKRVSSIWAPHLKHWGLKQLLWQKHWESQCHFRSLGRVFTPSKSFSRDLVEHKTLLNSVLPHFRAEINPQSLNSHCDY